MKYIYCYSAFTLTALFPRSAAGDAGAAGHGDAGGLPPGPRAGAGDQQGGQPGTIELSTNLHEVFTVFFQR